MASKSVMLTSTFVAIAAVPASPGATKAYRKVDFESFSMQMHVLFRLNLKVKLSSVVLFSCSSAFEDAKIIAFKRNK
jgi:archaellum component FlaF (FlaF/FlaG flagellin family)